MNKQRGQAMIYGLFILAMCSAALFFMFNTGQLTREKTKLVNTADAVAYSAGILQARALNLDAYSNRALIANEVLVAQMVSLASWSEYLMDHIDNTQTNSPDCVSYYSASHYFEYAPLCLAYYYKQYYSSIIDAIMYQVPNALNAALVFVEKYKTVIKASEDYMHSIAFKSMRGKVMQEVADANYANDGEVKVDPDVIPMTLMSDDWSSFSKKYEDNDRQILKDVVVQAANKDDFVRQRNWTAISNIFPMCALVGNFDLDRVDRTGSTQMNGLDEWSASDNAVRRNFGIEFTWWGRPYCGSSGQELGSGSQTANNNPSNSWFSASTRNWSNYTGLPSFYDLNNEQTRDDGSSWMTTPDPRMLLGVRVRREKDQLRTTDGKNAQIKQASDSRIGNYDTQLANDLVSGKIMAAVSTVEVYFDRPLNQKNNTWGNVSEKANLFNPFWRVRLVDNAKDVNAMRLLQVIP